MDTVWRPDIIGKNIPAYKALARCIAEDIKSGILQPGAQLPTHRALAEFLGLSIGTITRGYAEAERLQLIQSTVGSGTFVLSKSQRKGRLNINAPCSDNLDMSVSVALPLEDRYITNPYLDLTSDTSTLARMSRYHPEVNNDLLKDAHESWLSAIGVNLFESQHICTTIGGQNALYAALSSICEAGDTILSDQLTYPGLLAIGRRLNIKVVGVEGDSSGMLPESLSLAIQRYRPKAVYFMTRLSTPTGISMPQSRIDTVSHIVRKNAIWVVEDDVQGCLNSTSNDLFINTIPQSTLFVSSLSKALLGGLRIGLLYVPESLNRSIRNTLTTQFLVPPMLITELYTKLMLDNDLPALMAKQQQKLATRHRTAREILGRYMSESSTDSLNIWLSLPENWQPESFVKAMKEEGVMIKSAESFCTSRAYVPAAVRISLGGTVSDSQLVQGLGMIRTMLTTEAYESFV